MSQEIASPQTQDAGAEILRHGLQELGLTIPEGVDQKLLRYLDRVLETNQVMNLTSITDRTEAIHKHLIDSLSVKLLKSWDFPEQAAWMDIGTGAGFPGFVLALSNPSATVDLVESTLKKAHFLNLLCAEFGLLQRVRIHSDRAEKLAAKASPAAAGSPASRETISTLRESLDAVLFRGVSRIASLVELGAPFLKVGGIIVAYKGPKAQDELKEATKAMLELKFELAEKIDFTLPGVQEARSLVCLRKLAVTPKRFPRTIGLAQKEPIL